MTLYSTTGYAHGLSKTLQLPFSSPVTGGWGWSGTQQVYLWYPYIFYVIMHKSIFSRFKTFLLILKTSYVIIYQRYLTIFSMYWIFSQINLPGSCFATLSKFKIVSIIDQRFKQWAWGKLDEAFNVLWSILHDHSDFHFPKFSNCKKYFIQYYILYLTRTKMASSLTTAF